MTSTLDDLATRYFDSLLFPPYPVQEDALLAWFSSDQGVLVSAPTGTGKTLIAEAAIFEALHTGKRAYYTTPLIALTEQKLQELQQAVVRWGFSANDVGLVTGNRRVNPEAPILVVVAEILFNRLLHRDAFAFDDVSAVVMDEFHSFNDPERGIVWELTLGLLPSHVRLMLLSATVGNAYPFTSWLRTSHDRRVELIQSDERKVPLSFRWVGDQLLNELIEEMARGNELARHVPALVFCFNREQCWTVAEQLKGIRLIDDEHKKRLSDALERYDWSQGAGPKLKQILIRGIGVHHAGVMPAYKRIVEDLFQRKLLVITVCTETLAAGINLPARSVVLPSLLKGPPTKKVVVDPSAAHQMFGRAGRPQFDTEGFVFALPHEDDVKILRWKEKYDQIPEDTKDPGLRKAKKALKKKMPTRRTTQQYWSEAQFDKLRDAGATNLQSRGQLPWRHLAHLLEASPDVEIIRRLVSKRLMDSKQIAAGQRELDRMLMTLWAAGYVRLEPEPPQSLLTDANEGNVVMARHQTFEPRGTSDQRDSGRDSPSGKPAETPPVEYQPRLAHATEELPKLLLLRSVNPLYGLFLMQHLGIADQAERIQALESVLELPFSLGRKIRVPPPDQLPPGPLATSRIDVRLLQLGLATTQELGAASPDDEDEDDGGWQMFEEEQVYVLGLGDKLRRLFDHEFPHVHDVRTNSVWVAGELLEFGGNFNNYITSKQLQKQEGMIFRHLLRLILLINEFVLLSPPEYDPSTWQAEMYQLRDAFIATCRAVDPNSTDKMLEQAE